MSILAFLAGAIGGGIVGAAGWAISQAMARRRRRPVSKLPWWIGLALGVAFGSLAMFVTPSTSFGFLAVPLLALMAVMAATDVVEMRVYDYVSYSTLAYVLMIAFHDGRIVDALLGVLLYGGATFVFALFAEVGTADIVAVAIIGALAGLRAYLPVLLMVFGMLLGLVVLSLRRGKLGMVPGFPFALVSVVMWVSGWLPMFEVAHVF